MDKFKVFRLSDINQLEPTLNDFNLGKIMDYQFTMADYRVTVLVIRYEAANNNLKETE